MSETPDIPKSCATLAAQLLVEGCLPIIQGAVRGQAPVQPVPLQADERAKLGLADGGLTLFYPAGEEGVFLDAAANVFTLWFSGDDCERATEAVHQALTRAFPATQQLDDVAHPTDPRMRARAYRVELGQGRLAAINTSFSAAAAGKHTFSARVVAQQRPGA